MQVIDCPQPAPHQIGCICSGTGQLRVAPAGAARTCEVCGDPEKAYEPIGNVAMDGGKYVSAKCAACDTPASQKLIDQLNRERGVSTATSCKTCGDESGKPLGEYVLEDGTFFGVPCQTCGTRPAPELIAQLNGKEVQYE